MLRAANHVAAAASAAQKARSVAMVIRSAARTYSRGLKPLKGNFSTTGLLRPTLVGYHLACSSSSLDSSLNRRASMSSVAAETHEFQAETRQLLDIVTHSIYSEKEVFLRELISNASDAIEKVRHLQVTGVEIADPTVPHEINIYVDKEKKQLSISDAGIGMTKEDMMQNLGTIARSGSKAFVKQLKEEGSASRAAEGIIGQFGVGFYSSFMVADSVQVLSKPYTHTESQDTHMWSSSGTGSYDIQPVPYDTRGSKIVLQLKDECEEFLDVEKIKDIIKRYSNFVAFPIKVNGEVVNTVQAIWSEDKSHVTEDQYQEFYKFIANAWDTPTYTLHFRTDAPIDLKALFFFPSFHTERFGMARLQPGVNLYSRKILIEPKCKDILPEWMRFIKGVVDSEDLPLSIAREKPQDARLLTRIRDVLVRKCIKMLEDEMKNDRVKYQGFFKEFGFFLKEGVCQDHKNQANISKLLMFESSKSENGSLTSFDEYISRCPPEQSDIFYLVAPTRELALASPYYETFKKSNTEVFFLYNAVDDFVMSNLSKYNGRNLKSAESADVKDANEDTSADGLTKEQSEALCTWLLDVLNSRVKEVKITSRLSDSPAIVTDNESGALRRMLRFVENQNAGTAQPLPKQQLQINPNHPIIKMLSVARETHPEVSNTIAEQLFDNALIAAGLMDDSRSMLPRLNLLLERVLSTSVPVAEAPTPAEAAEPESSPSPSSS